VFHCIPITVLAGDPPDLLKKRAQLLLLAPVYAIQMVSVNGPVRA